MRKITLIGDSIRQIGYGKKVPEILGDEYEVFQPNDNCRFAKYTLLGIEMWGSDMAGSDVIHWNNGLWDTCDRYGDGAFSKKEEYVDNMLRIAKLLMKITPNLIFATTTPCRKGHKNQKNEVIDEYNAALVPELKKLGVKINDLNALIRGHEDEYICDDLIHLSEKGIDICANKVVELIKSFE